MAAERTWFFTGTWAHATPDLDAVDQETTKFIQRIRDKETTIRVVEGVRERERRPIRFFYAYEKTKRGRWHVHALIHCSHSLTRRKLDSCWQPGFSHSKLANFEKASYVSKYVGKGMKVDPKKKTPRTRASLKYGHWVMERDQLTVKELHKLQGEVDKSEVWLTNVKQVIKEFSYGKEEEWWEIDPERGRSRNR